MKPLLYVYGALILTGGSLPLLHLLRHLLHPYGRLTLVLYGRGFLWRCTPLLLARGQLLTLVLRERRQCPIHGRLLNWVEIQLPSGDSLLLYEVELILLRRERLIVGLPIWLHLGIRKVRRIHPKWLLLFL